MSAGLINRLKWQDRLLVNGQPVHTDYSVSPGDTITVLLEQERPAYPAQDGPLHILYEDGYLLAVDKPAGMLIHPSRARNEGTLANFVAGYYEKTGQIGAFHPITRLDRDTFGIVLVAKNAHIHALLQAAPPDKRYRAWVYGGPAQDSGVLEAPIERCPLPSLLRCVSPAGKPSATGYRVLRREEGCSLLELQPITGRTHQLRLHCAHFGFPILGDPQYGSEEARAFSLARGLTGQQLCATSVAFSHPITGQPLLLTSDMEPKLRLQETSE